MKIKPGEWVVLSFDEKMKRLEEASKKGRR